MSAVNTAEWLDAIHAHHGRVMSLPVLVCAELLLGKTTAATVAEAIAARGVSVGDSDMARTTEADVAIPMHSLCDLGFLGSALVTDHADGEEHLYELRYP
jgi:hypothetical protein